VSDVVVTSSVTIPASELSWRFTTSGGPGGQHANRAATRAILRFEVATSGAFEEQERDRVLQALADQFAGGVVTIAVDESRSQWRNRQIARRRLVDLLRAALRPESPARRPTRPTAGSRRRRVDAKRRRSAKKKLRRPPEDQD